MPKGKKEIRYKLYLDYILPRSFKVTDYLHNPFGCFHRNQGIFLTEPKATYVPAQWLYVVRQSFSLLLQQPHDLTPTSDISPSACRYSCCNSYRLTLDSRFICELRFSTTSLVNGLARCCWFLLDNRLLTVVVNRRGIASCCFVVFPRHTEQFLALYSKLLRSFSVVTGLC